jgi:uncharacterized protein (DUF362 family)
MKKTIDRRTFIRQSAALSAAAALGGRVLPSQGPARTRPEIVAAGGEDYFNNTLNAVERLGGMSVFVPKNSTVGLLINTPFKNPGTHTHPDVALAVLNMCFDAGASTVISIEAARSTYWTQSALASKFETLISKVQPAGSGWRKITLPKAGAAREIEVKSALTDVDVLINVPVVKDHTGVRMSGSLKNMMGATSRTTNQFFHKGSNPKATGWYEDPDHLAQCIADLNLVRKPDLCVLDASEFIVTNGPFGPGEIKKGQMVVAGSDPVAVDTFAARMLGLNSDDVAMLKKAEALGLGQTDLTKLRIEQVKT